MTVLYEIQYVNTLLLNHYSGHCFLEDEVVSHNRLLQPCCTTVGTVTAEFLETLVLF